MKYLPSGAQYIGAAILLGVGALLLPLQVDRQFINLYFSEGRDFTVTLESEKTYTQSFITTRSPITQIGLHLRTLEGNLPDKPVSITLQHNGNEHSTYQLSPVFIDNAGATNITIEPAITAEPTDTVTLTLTIPPKLHRKVGIQTREQDDSFPKESVRFAINGVEQQNPMAYHVYHHYRPPLALQLGILSIVFAILLVIPKRFYQLQYLMPVYVCLIPFLYQIPFITNTRFSLTLYVLQGAILVVFFFVLRRFSLSIVASLLGATILALTTWLPFHLVNHTSEFSYLSMRDMFFDPNQVIDTHASGSYLGLPAGALALLGLLMVWKERRLQYFVGVGLILSLFVFIPPVFTFLNSLVPSLPSYLVIGIIMPLAILAAYGVELLLRYLGPKDRLVHILLIGIVGICLLDLLYVGATALESFIIFAA